MPLKFLNCLLLRSYKEEYEPNGLVPHFLAESHQKCPYGCQKILIVFSHVLFLHLAFGGRTWDRTSLPVRGLYIILLVPEELACISVTSTGRFPFIVFQIWHWKNCIVIKHAVGMLNNSIAIIYAEIPSAFSLSNKKMYYCFINILANKFAGGLRQ